MSFVILVLVGLSSEISSHHDQINLLTFLPLGFVVDPIFGLLVKEAVGSLLQQNM